MKMFLLWIDQGVNLLFGGNVDSSISGRCYVHREQKYWDKMRKAIDWAFHPLEGEGHCMRAYKNDNESYEDIKGIRRVVFPFFVYAGCLVIWPISKWRGM